MLRFDSSLLSVEIVMLRRITTALGGSFVYVEDGEEKRSAVPFAVARDFINRCDKVSKYLEPVPVAVTRYGDHVVCMERQNILEMLRASEAGEDLDETNWVPVSKRVVDALINNLDSGDKEWYVDGRYIYSFDGGNDVAEVVENSPSIKSTNDFKQVQVNCIDMMVLYEKTVMLDARTCIAFTTGTDYGISPPLWKASAVQLRDGNVIMSDERDDERTTAADKSNTGNVLSNFNTIDDRVFVNLGFALRCGVDLSTIFDYEAIEKLRLPYIMADLGTVNLPAVPNEIKMTYNIGTKFTHMLAWMIGVYHRIDNLNDLLRVRALIKYLTTRGIYRYSSLTTDNIYKDVNNTIIPLTKIDLDYSSVDTTKKAQVQQLLSA